MASSTGIARQLGIGTAAASCRRYHRTEATLSPSELKPIGTKSFAQNQDASQRRHRSSIGSPDSSSVLVPTSGILAAGRVDAVERPLENPGAISLDAIDRAMETVNADLCWELIVRLNSFLVKRNNENGRVSKQSDAFQTPGYDLRSQSQLVTAEAGPGPSSMGKGIGAYDWNVRILQQQDSSSGFEPQCLDGEPQSDDWAGEEEGVGEETEALVDSADQQGSIPENYRGGDGWSLAELLGSRHKRLVGMFLQSGRHDLAVMYANLVPPMGRAFTSVLRGFLEHNEGQVVLDILTSHEQRGVLLDEYAMSAKISALGRLGRFEDARYVFNEDLAHRVSIYTFNSMMDAYGRAGNNESLKELVCLMKDKGLRPDAVTYTSLIRSNGVVGCMADVKKLVEEMLGEGLRPTPHTFTVVFEAAERNRDGDAQWLLSLLDIMADNEIRMNQQILGSLIAACSWAKMSSDQIDKVFECVANVRMSRQKCCTPKVYNSLLLFCTRQDLPEKVVDIWDAMQDDGITPNGHLYSAALSACCVGSVGPLLTSFAKRIAQELRYEWRNQNYRRSGLPRGASLLGALNSLLNFYVRTGDLDEALEVYRGMRRHGPKPEAITYNTLMSAFANTGGVKKSLELLAEMQEDGLQPTVRTYGTLLNACAKGLEVGRAQKLFEHMKLFGVTPSVECYTSLIDACVKEGSLASLEQAFVEFNRMKAEGLKPTAVTYGCLLLACERKGETDRAFTLYREAHEQDVQPTDAFHKILVTMCSRADRLDAAVEMIKTLARRNVSAEQDTLNSLVRVLCKDFVERAVIIFGIMQDRKLPLTKGTYCSLVAACSSGGNTGMAKQLYLEMAKRGIPLDRASGSALVQGLCRAGELTAALQVADNMMMSVGMPSLRKSIDTGSGGHPGEFLKDRIVRRYARLPDVFALGSLVGMLAQRGEVEGSLRVFDQIQLMEGDTGLQLLVARSRHVFESLIETCCRKGRIEQALEVFDEWKAAATVVMAENKMKGGEEWAYKRYPAISQVTLAFLESRCRQEPQLEWRVYDVCATMRQQREWAHEAELPRPQPPSHHFSEEWP